MKNILDTNNSIEEYNSFTKNAEISTEGKNPSQIPTNQTPITKPGILSSILNFIYKKESSNK